MRRAFPFRGSRSTIIVALSPAPELCLLPLFHPSSSSPPTSAPTHTHTLAPSPKTRRHPRSHSRERDATHARVPRLHTSSYPHSLSRPPSNAHHRSPAIPFPSVHFKPGVSTEQERRNLPPPPRPLLSSIAEYKARAEQRRAGACARVTGGEDGDLLTRHHAGLPPLLAPPEDARMIFPSNAHHRPPLPLPRSPSPSVQRNPGHTRSGGAEILRPRP
ncbi:hypothetical protein DFH07DRAFT_968652 [Mycena maculata]|uniref:Uncharacterized protein n=1 Tax=Mycena maculata TaxID=230809 RepID=A0AAD7MTU9_9AGAR|nr:hypothetical protein DFH07DRAFT_968652 [Mycena maculata]